MLDNSQSHALIMTVSSAVESERHLLPPWAHAGARLSSSIGYDFGARKLVLCAQGKVPKWQQTTVVFHRGKVAPRDDLNTFVVDKVQRQYIACYGNIHPLPSCELLSVLFFALESLLSTSYVLRILVPASCAAMEGLTAANPCAATSGHLASHGE